MPIEVTGTAIEIKNAINDFRVDYHDDFKTTRSSGHQYLSQQPCTDNIASDLGQRLRCALGNWGAGRRGAPRVRSETEYVEALSDPKLYNNLVKLSGTSL